ncbi:MAG: Gmad2 immunoglobulin-like domain-containing protein [Parcubacteria group bacterium]|nr:Gmad2 immunoglobulin-like domain-containing protein [Parcubacteria group bacterium]MCR4343009.1 Gmad2 immunoglobulin-like domain-containing protein [Patescibacteria group bacterium]
MKKIIVIILILIASLIGLYFWSSPSAEAPMDMTSMAEKEGIIRVTTPLPEQVITSPLIVEGEARGYWFFEATFPLVLTDWDGRIIAQSYATALDEWMTEDFVPFRGVLEFEEPEFIGEFSNRGALILKKDNPSGLPEHDDALEMTIYFR